MADGSVRSYFVDITGSSEGLIRAAGEGEAAAGSLEKRVGGVGTSFAQVGSASKTHIGGVATEQTNLLEKGFGKVDNAIKGAIGSVVSMGASFAGLGAVMGAGAALDIGIKDAVSFQQKLLLVQTQAGDTTDNLTQLGNALEAMGPKVGQTPDQLAQGFFHLASAGYTGKQALDMLQQSAELAAVGQSDLESTTNAVVGVMKSGVGGITDASSAVGVLNAIVGAGNMHLQDLVDAMGTGVLPVAATFGLSIQSLGAAMTFLSDQSIPPIDAANELRRVITTLGAPTAQAAKLLTDAGVGAQDAADSTSAMQRALVAAHVTTTEMSSDLKQPNGLVVALQDLKDHMDNAGVSADEQAATIARAFGGSKMAAPVLDLYANLDKVKGKFDQINTAAGNFPKDWAAQQKTGAQALQDVKSAADVALTSLGTGLLPYIEQLGQWVASHSTDIQNFGKTVGQDLGIAARDAGQFISGTLFPAIHDVGTFIGDHIQEFKDLAEAIGALYVTHKGISLARGLASDFQSLLGVTGKLTGIGGLSNAAPLPVYVTNPGFGGAGGSGEPVPAGAPVVGGGSGVLGALGNTAAIAGDVGGAGIILGTVGASGKSVGADDQSGAWSYDQQNAINQQTDAIKRAAHTSDDVAYMWAQYQQDAQHTINDLDVNEFMWGTATGDTAALNRGIADLMQRHDITSAGQLQSIENAWNKGIVNADNMAQYTNDWDNVTKLYGAMNANQQQEFNTLFASGVTSVSGMMNMMGEVNDYSQKYGPPTSSDLQTIAGLVSFGVTDVDAIHKFLKDAVPHASDVNDNLKTLAGLMGGNVQAAQDLMNAIHSELGNIGPSGGGSGSGHSITDLMNGWATGGGVSAAAAGGPQSNRVKVGEHGEELVDLPAGSYVHPNFGGVGFGQMGGYGGRGDSGAGGGDTHVHIHGDINLPGVRDVDQFLDAIQREALRRKYNQGHSTIFGAGG